jgi:hypothetical protein
MKMKAQQLRKIVFTVASLVLLILLTACAGVGTNANGSITSVTGTITAVSAANHSMTLSVGGTSYTVNGLSDQEVQALQGHIGQTYTVQVTQNSDGSYTLTVGTNPTLAANETPGVNETPEASETPGANETPNATETGNATGSFTIIALAQNVSSSSVTVTLPDGAALTAAITSQTDISGLNGTLSNGQKVKVEADASTSGFTSTKISAADSSDDANSAELVGVTTQAVGSDHVLHFTVGSHAFNYAISSSADVGDFNNNASSIASGTPVKVTIQFSGTTGSIVKISNNS